MVGWAMSSRSITPIKGIFYYMKKEYNKLVRDRIPEILLEAGLNFEISTLSETEYRQLLRQKIIEEAQELAESNAEHLLTELADLYEVLDALIETYGLSLDAILKKQKQRRLERGGFKQRIQLLWTEEAED
jgi:predicted house-cleaning noncanonical NTP pyrophosphatase (MazG superfamily)